MNLQLLIGFLLSVLPISELRGGLPVVLDYVIKNNLPIIPFFILVVFLNILVIFFVFIFLNFFHNFFLKFNLYNNFFNKRVVKLQKKSLKLQNKFNDLGYLALVLFVAVPLPITGAWTGSLLAWLLKFNQKKSIFAISVGVFISGLIVLVSYMSLLNIIL